jgi:hypothetical protein
VRRFFLQKALAGVVCQRIPFIGNRTLPPPSSRGTWPESLQMVTIPDKKILVTGGKLKKSTSVHMETTIDYPRASIVINISIRSQDDQWSIIKFENPIPLNRIAGSKTLPLGDLLACFFSGPDIDHLIMESLLIEKLEVIVFDLAKMRCCFSIEGILEKPIWPIEEDSKGNFEPRTP